MPLKYPDILEHNNSNFALVDITELRGNAFPLGQLSETGSIPTDKRNVGALVFVSSSQEFYGFYGQSTSDWDTTSNWRLISDISGSSTAPGSDTQILYNSGGVISADSGLVYSGSRVGIGTTSPTETLTVEGNISGSGNAYIAGNVGIGTTSPTEALTLGQNNTFEIFGTADQTTNFRSLQVSHDGSTALINSTGGGTQNGKRLRLQSSFREGNPGITYLEIDRALMPRFNFYTNPTSTPGNFTKFDFTSIATNGEANFFDAAPTVNQSGTAGYRVFRLSPYIQTIGSGVGFLMDVGTNSAGGGAGTHTSKFVITGDGDIGIGTSSPSHTLDVSGSGRFTNDLTITGSLTVSGSSTLTNIGPAIFSGSVEGIGGFTGSFSGSFIAPGSDTQILYNNGGVISADSGLVYSGNRVGIGTSTPAQTLDVSGSVIIRPSFTSATISFLSLGSSQSRLVTTGNFAIWPGGSETMRLLSTGEVGIGTSAPSERLTVQGNISGSGNAYIEGSVGIGTTSPDEKLEVYQGNIKLGTATNTTSKLIFERSNTNRAEIYVNSLNALQFDVASLERMRIDSNGIGIGTSSPNNKLDVRRANSGIVAEFQSTAGNPDEYVDVKLISGNTTAGTYGTILRHQRVGTSGADFAILTNPTLTGTPVERFRITKDGNVGIGTPSPSYKLDVSGSGRFTDGLIVTGSILHDGDLTVTGTVTAQEFHTEFVSASIIYDSGSTKFGDSSDDVHQFTGSLEVSASIKMTGDGHSYPHPLEITSDSIILPSNSTTSRSVLRQSSTGGFLSLRDSSGNEKAIIRSYSSSGVQAFFTAGNVGIGTNTPPQRLTVEGNISGSGNAYIEGSVGIGTISPTNTLHVAGTTRLSGSYDTAASGSILVVEGSGSAQPIFKVQGSVGELFAITDSLSGSLFSVNDITGLPILEVFSDNTINLGDYQAPTLFTTTEVITDNSGSFTVYNIPTASYDGAFYEYTLKSGSNARAGNIMAIWSGTSVNFTETTTTDFGNTTGVSLNVSISGSNMVLTGSFDAADWHLKTIIKSI